MSDRELKAQLAEVFRQLVRKMVTDWSNQVSRTCSMTQFHILKKLALEGPKKVSELAQSLDITPGAITVRSDKLIEEGYARRYRDEQDRRVVYLEITEKGSERFQRIEEQRDRMIELMFDGFSDDELRREIAVFKRILHNLQHKGEE
ncbi:MAG TPA: MarR family transcriptional regulator [Bacilli bacterium]